MNGRDDGQVKEEEEEEIKIVVCAVSCQLWKCGEFSWMLQSRCCFWPWANSTHLPLSPLVCVCADWEEKFSVKQQWGNPEGKPFCWWINTIDTLTLCQTHTGCKWTGADGNTKHARTHGRSLDGTEVRDLSSSTTTNRRFVHRDTGTLKTLTQK